jgi:predicted metal-dependent peptidase
MPNSVAPEATQVGAPRHTHRGTRAIQRLVEFAPSSGGLALWVAHRDVDDDAPVSTDGHSIGYGPAFEALPLPVQTGWVAHAVLHVALRHAPRYVELQRQMGDVDLRLFNTCADAIVNSALSHLSWLQLPPQAVLLERLLDTALGQQLGTEAALLAWDVERLYRAIDDRRAPDDQRGRAQAKAGGGGGSTAGERGQAGTEPRQAAQPSRADGPRAAAVRVLGAAAVADLRPVPQGDNAPEAQAEQTRTWAERIARAHAGDGVHSMLRTLLADLPRSRTPWEQVLRTRLARGLSLRPELSWSRPSRSYLARQGRAGPGRRMPFEPGVLPSRRVPRLVLVVDVSGSIDNDLLQRFAREIQALTRRLEAGLSLVVGDDRVRQVQHFGPGDCDLSGLAFDGGGGTDFTPLLEEASRHDPDITVVLTDLEGPARHRPRAPVLWAVPPSHAAAVAPFGRKLVLD